MNRDNYWMGLALELASRGQGRVEPNPMVGCVIVENDQLIASGYHERFGGPHAEVHAYSKCDPKRLENATVFVTLEPCSHFGKTPPCVDLLLAQPPGRVVVAMQDPFPAVSGNGIRALRERNVKVDVGVLESQARELNAPYLKLLQTGTPWVIAKWAMTLDGAIATRERHSQWISNELSRKVVHQLRNRMDAIIVGIGTALADDPLLTTRLNPHEESLRSASRVVLDRQGRLPLDSKLVQSARQWPLVVAVSHQTPSGYRKSLEMAGCDVWVIPQEQYGQSVRFVLKQLGDRRCTNVLIEGGGTILGHAFDEQLIDEVHCFIAPKIIGGNRASRPVGGEGVSMMSQASLVIHQNMECLEGDVHVFGRVLRQ